MKFYFKVQFRIFKCDFVFFAINNFTLTAFYLFLLFKRFWLIDIAIILFYLLDASKKSCENLLGNLKSTQYLFIIIQK
jgi:hypothetical protein